jgi:hypothetical protein
MIDKIDLLIPGSDNHFISPGVRDLTTEFFNIKKYEPGQTYDVKRTLLVANQYQFNYYNEIIKKLMDQGLRLVLDNLQEAEPYYDIMTTLTDFTVLHMIGSKYPKCVIPKKHKLVQVPMFFWIHEALAFVGTVGDNRNHPRIFNNADKIFLMLINHDREHRRNILEVFDPVLPCGLWSYRARQKFLPNDVDHSLPGANRYNNPKWYDDTWCSVTVETMMNSGNRIFITEKTFKPIQMQHPFILLGAPNSLGMLKKHGFLTYDNIFDESYDTINDQEKRIQSVYEQVSNIKIRKYDQETFNRIQYNRERFYNLSLIKERFFHDIVEPMLEFAQYNLS